MRAIIQRAVNGKVSVNNQVIGEFDGPGLVVLVGATHTDTPRESQKLAEKIHGLRIFDREFISHFDHICIPPSSPRELSLGELGLPVLVISQFTLYASTAKGRRPTWDAAAPRSIAEPLVDSVVQRFRDLGTHVETGQFGADMNVSLTNSGPMTLVIDVEA